MPDILIVLKACARYGITHNMIKELSYNDLLALIIEHQIDDIREYLSSQKGQTNEIIHADEKTVTEFLLGGIPKKGGLT